MISERKLRANRENAKKAADSRRVEKIKCICKQCRKGFEIYPSQLKKGFGSVCSWACRVKYRRGENAIAAGPRLDMMGDKNINWKNGVSLVPKKQRNITKEHLAWKRRIFARDGGTCKYCGATKNLNAHHILPYKEYPELAYDIDNGITLCYECHKTEHSIGYAARRVFKAMVSGKDIDGITKALRGKIYEHIEPV